MSARDDLYEYADSAHLGGDELDGLLDRVEAEAVARAAVRPVNETLVKARDAAADMFEVEVGERRPMWRVVITDSESPTGIAPVCTAEGDRDEHDEVDDGTGPMRDEHGVYGCCPTPWIDTFLPTTAAYLVELLNADAEAGEQQ